jgi:glycosyltransferase involved in cell wall biosynthesis
MSRHHPSVSVVVPVYNEEFGLGMCLEALLKQDYPGSYEIIVVDNASTDRSAEIARSFGCRVIYETQRGYVHALRAGIARATGTIVAVTDGDSLVPISWLSHCTRLLSRSGVVACSGAFDFFDGAGWVRLLGAVFGRFNYHLAGANMAFLRSAFDAVGGLDPSINLGADVALGMRLKRVGKVVVDRSLVVSTSSRRFEMDFFRTICHYYLNDISLLLLKRPLFHHFRAIRRGPRLQLSGRRFSTRSKFSSPPM